MLYFIHGNDEVRGREKLHAILNGLFLKRPDALYFHIDTEGASAHDPEELARAQGLFGEKHIVFFDKALENEEVAERLLGSLSEFETSEHAFIFFEGAVDKKTLSRFEKYGERVYEFKKKEDAPQEFNLFLLTDALGTRDKKKLWTVYQKAKHAGVSDEEIHGILFWQVKTMLLARGAKTAEDAGLKPFPFKKSLGFLKNYKEEEIRDLSKRLVELLHDARLGAHELEPALERFILSI